MRITIQKEGPYLVSGGVPLLLGEIVTNEDGDSVSFRTIRTIETPETYVLCRCGHSENKPFCDGAHMKHGFSGATTASHAPHAEQARAIEGEGIVLLDATAFCMGARFCDRGLGAWKYTETSTDETCRTTAIEESCLCPSGRLVMREIDGEDRVGNEGGVRDNDGVLEYEYEPSIMVLEDPINGMSSALWVRGGIEIVDEHGQAYEVRNRQTLCRCGESANKPFCDGTHYRVRFQDGLT
ncbi:MAG: CDGSH iron-sulfur domain-containing protein [Coriobacteriia bacterium]|nr:CDGSH iron-sulfur domain-containing protein [Coriobacteriia bacterium]